MRHDKERPTNNMNEVLCERMSRWLRHWDQHSTERSQRSVVHMARCHAPTNHRHSQQIHPSSCVSRVVTDLDAQRTSPRTPHLPSIYAVT
jgi:hypothetical protein